MVRVAGIAPASSSFQARPSATDITPWKMAAQAGFAPTPCRLTGGRTTVIRLSNGAAGRILTRICPLRRRMPHIFGHGSPRKCRMENHECRMLGKAVHFWRSVIPQSPFYILHLKVVSAAGIAPAITWSQAKHVAATLRADWP